MLFAQHSVTVSHHFYHLCYHVFLPLIHTRKLLLFPIVPLSRKRRDISVQDCSDDSECGFGRCKSDFSCECHPDYKKNRNVNNILKMVFCFVVAVNILYSLDENGHCKISITRSWTEWDDCNVQNLLKTTLKLIDMTDFFGDFD